MEFWCAGKILVIVGILEISVSFPFLIAIPDWGLMLINLFDKLWNILGSKELFQQVHDINGQYDAKSHLAEMISLLGPPPRSLITKSKAMLEYNWPQPVTNDTGKPCNTAQEFFDGPFFNAEGGLMTILFINMQYTDYVQGEFCHNELIPSRSLEDTTTFLEEKEKQNFLSFVGKMVTWLPEKRQTARELMDHPFLKLGSR